MRIGRGIFYHFLCYLWVITAKSCCISIVIFKSFWVSLWRCWADSFVRWYYMYVIECCSRTDSLSKKGFSHSSSDLNDKMPIFLYMNLRSLSLKGLY